MSDLAQQFALAQARIKQVATLGNDVLLELYGLYKQAAIGDATGARPGITDLRGRAKFDAWAARKGMPAETAMQRYIAVVDKFAP